MKKPREKHNYIDNKELLVHMIDYVTECRAAEAINEKRPRVPEKVGEAIYLIATRLATKPNFIGYSYKEDMIGDGIENCLMYIHNFNPEKSKNPFSYITTIIYYAFIRRIQKEQKQQHIKNKVFDNAAVMNNLVSMSPEDKSHYSAFSQQMDPEKAKILADKFEKKLQKNKKEKGSK